MKAVYMENYGAPDVLKIREIEKPEPKKGEILVRIEATSVNFGDLIARDYRSITPQNFHMPFLFWLIGGLYFGFRKPRVHILGSEFAGVVESAGEGVKDYRTGDRIFGYCGAAMGAYSEYMCVRANSIIAKMPDNLDFIQAAAVPYGAMMAIDLLRQAHIKKGERLLVNGASGGIGPAVVQFASRLGAEITGVCGTSSLEYVKTMGATKVIDYTKEDVFTAEERYDCVIDILGKAESSKVKNILSPGGRCCLVSFKMKQIMTMLASAIAGDKRLYCLILNESRRSLEYVRDLAAQGAYKVLVDRTFPLEDASKAHEYAQSGKKRGSVIIVTGESK